MIEKITEKRFSDLIDPNAILRIDSKISDSITIIFSDSNYVPSFNAKINEISLNKSNNHLYVSGPKFEKYYRITKKQSELIRLMQ